jgi:flagellar hook-basal body complex protein FliE
MINPVGSPLFSPQVVEQPQGAAFMGNLAPLQPQTVQPTDFSSMLESMITDTASAVKTAESTSLNAVHGKASIQQVAEAVLAAEMTMQGAIAVRDKITAAYLELSRMAI